MNTEQADTLGSTARIVALGKQLSQLGRQLALQQQRIAALEAENAALRTLLLRSTRWIRSLDSTANEVELAQLKSALDAALAAKGE